MSDIGKLKLRKATIYKQICNLEKESNRLSTAFTSDHDIDVIQAIQRKAVIGQELAVAKTAFREIKNRIRQEAK